MKRLAAIFLCLLIVILLLAGCEGENVISPTEQETHTTNIEKSTENVEPQADDGFETILFLNQIFPLKPNKNISEQTAVVNSKSELLSFINNNRSLGFSDEAIKSFKSFDDKFFRLSSLIIVTASFKGENPDDVTLQLKENRVDVNIKAQRTEKKEDAKIVLVPIQYQKAESNIKVDVSFFADCQSKNPHEGEASFTGVVVRDMKGCMIVQTNDIYDRKTEAVLAEVSKDTRDKTEQDEYSQGTKVKVYYDGIIAEIYPARIDNVYSIEILGSN